MLMRVPVATGELSEPQPLVYRCFLRHDYGNERDPRLDKSVLRIVSTCPRSPTKRIEILLRAVPSAERSLPDNRSRMIRITEKIKFKPNINIKLS